MHFSPYKTQLILWSLFLAVKPLLQVQLFLKYTQYIDYQVSLHTTRCKLYLKAIQINALKYMKHWFIPVCRTLLSNDVILSDTFNDNHTKIPPWLLSIYNSCITLHDC